MKRKRPLIHIWVPGIREGSGGIQGYCRNLIRFVVEGFPDHDVHVIVKNDEARENDPLRGERVEFTSVSRFPAWMRTAVMAAAGLMAALRERPALMLGAHLHFLPALRIIRGLIKRPYIGFLYGIEAWGLRPGKRVSAMLRADGLIAISRFTRDRVLEENPGAALRIHVVPCTFDWGKFSIGPKPLELLRRYGLRPNQPVMLTVSRLAASEQYKGHRPVLASMRKVLKTLPDAMYIIAGDGDDLLALKAVVAELKLQESVIFTGQIPSGELQDHYKLCDVFVMPSIKEGFGIVFLEAMASGKPTISGNIDGSTDAVDDGRLGVMVDPYDSDAIADALVEILTMNHPNRLLFDPQGLRNAVIDRFGFPQVCESMTKVIRSIWTGSGELEVQGQMHPVKLHTNAPKVVVVTLLTSPYQVEFFNALSAAQNCHLEVIYLTSHDRERQWATPIINHKHLILNEAPHRREEAREAVRQADLVVFNYYVDLFTLRAIRERARLGRPWAFWGERPGFYQTGMTGVIARWFLLWPLHRSSVPIWGVGRFGVEGYQREFGTQRTYQNIPYFSELKEFLQIERPPGAPRVFFYSGSFTSRKGSDMLAESFRRIVVRHPQARLVLVGAGEMERQMRNTLQPCADRVTWLGFQPWHKLPECYQQGTIFCFPSRYDGWGLSMVEALASGMPSIGTDRTGSALEFLTDQKAGWLIEAGNRLALEQAMEQALLLPEPEFQAMQAAARSAVSQSGLEAGVRRFTVAVEDALSGSPRPSAAPSPHSN